MVTLEIDDQMNPWVKELDTTNQSQYLNTLLNIGHTVATQITLRSSNEYTEKLLELQQEKSEGCMNSTVDAIREMMSSISSRMDSIEQRTSHTVASSQDKMLQLVESFTGKTKTSSTRGDMAENCIEEILETEFPNETIYRSSGVAHEADIQLHSQDSPAIIFESKNYTTIVQKKEIDKFKADMIRTNIRYGIFFSFNSRITGRKNMDIEQFNNKYILYISNIGFNADWVVLATRMMKSIAKLDTGDKSCFSKEMVKDKIQAVIGALTRLNDLASCLTKTKATLIEQEGNIRESLDAIHTAYICNEAEMNRVMKDIRQEINYVLDNVNELDKEAEENIDILLENIEDKKQDHMRAIFTQIVLHNYRITKDKDNTVFYVSNKHNDTILSKISVKGKIKLSIPNIGLDMDCTKKNSLSNLETYFQILSKL
tara:strand:+ start:425 stop:1708 length:1284 start_codon:yes stop_codon:yes gene_type:complete